MHSLFTVEVHAAYRRQPLLQEAEHERQLALARRATAARPPRLLAFLGSLIGKLRPAGTGRCPILSANQPAALHWPVPPSMNSEPPSLCLRDGRRAWPPA